MAVDRCSPIQSDRRGEDELQIRVCKPGRASSVKTGSFSKGMFQFSIAGHWVGVDRHEGGATSSSYKRKMMLRHMYM